MDVHKKRLRRKKRKLRQCKSTASTATAATSTTFNSTTGTIHRHLYSSHSQSIDTPKNSCAANEMSESPSKEAQEEDLENKVENCSANSEKEKIDSPQGQQQPLHSKFC